MRRDFDSAPGQWQNLAMTAPNPYDREPTPDERAGMDWWNSLDISARRYWLNASETVAEAWAKFKWRERRL
jgi:hypothetical protein